MSNSNNRIKIVSGMFWKMGERVLCQGVSFVVSTILARLLMPDDYGLLALVVIFVNLSSVFTTNGFSSALIQKKNANAVDFSTIYFCSQFTSIFLYVILFYCAPLIAQLYRRNELILLLRVYALCIPLGVYQSILSAYVSRHMLFRKTFFVSIISSLISGIVGIFLAYKGLGVWALVAQTMTASIVTTIVMAYAVPWRLKLCFSKESAKSLMRYGSKVLLADLSGTFFGELRSLIIGGVYSSADLAFYSKGQQLPTLITTNLSSTIMSVMFPALSNESDHLEQIKQMARRSLKVLSFVLVPCMFGLAAVMEPLILLLFTEKWSQTIPYGQVLSLGYCVGVFGIVSLQVLKAIGRSDVVLKLEVWKKPVYILLLLVGVKINVFAIAMTMALYDIYGVIINMLQMKKYINYSMREQFKDLLPAFSLGIVMAVVVLFVPTFGNLIATLMIKVLVGATIYIGGAVLFKVETFRYLLSVVQEFLKKRGTA